MNVSIINLNSSKNVDFLKSWGHINIFCVQMLFKYIHVLYTNSIQGWALDGNCVFILIYLFDCSVWVNDVNICVTNTNYNNLFVVIEYLCLYYVLWCMFFMYLIFLVFVSHLAARFLSVFFIINFSKFPVVFSSVGKNYWKIDINRIKYHTLDFHQPIFVI